MAFLKRCDRKFARLGRNHVIAEIRKHRSDKFSYRRLIIHDQNHRRRVVLSNAFIFRHTTWILEPGPNTGNPVRRATVLRRTTVRFSTS